MTGRGEDRVCLGAIAGAHGVRGEVRIKPFTEDPLAIGDYGSLLSEDGASEFELQGVRLQKAHVVARIAGVSDRDAAEALKGTRLYVPRDRLPEPDEEDTWYHADLIGLAARAPDGAPLGTVVSIQDYGAGDLIELQLGHDRPTVFVPFTREMVPEVDIAAGHIVVDAPDELLGREDDTEGAAP
jgi:16S rRNA processing protein RimM